MISFPARGPLLALLLAFAFGLAGVGGHGQILAPTNSVWSYRKGTNEASSPVAAWRQAGFDDAAWSRGKAPFYYDAEPVYTGNTELADMRNTYTSVYLRRSFAVSGVDNLGRLRLRVLCDDGFVLWLNGVLVTNVNKATTDLGYGAVAIASVSEPLEWSEFAFDRPQSWLQEGVNQLAVQAFNNSRTSSDFVFEMELSATARDAVAPTVAQVRPAPGTIGELTSVTVTFSEPVTGVGFSDLLVNDRPAIGVSGGGTTYTFTLEPPPYGPVRIGWDPGAAITDFAESPNRFDTGAPSANWVYQLVDSTPPSVAEVTPAPGNTVRGLSQVEVRFSEPVSGVDADDLLVGGRPARSVSGSGAGPYVFQFAEVAPGVVAIAWAEDHEIVDLAASPNGFAGAGWSYTVDPSFARQPVRISELLAGTSGNVGLRDEDGELGDWIELQNRGTEAVNLRGWALTDDPEDPGKWVFPEARIAPGGFLVVFASAKDRRPAAAASGRLHTNFKLVTEGEYLALFDAESPRGRVAEFAPGYPGQRNDVSFGYDPADQLRHFTVPTPGASNGVSPVTGVLPEVDFNVGRGVFERAFDLHLSSAVAGAEIRYTTDGSEPAAGAGTVYAGPLAVDRTTVVRAAAFKAGYLPAASVTHTYVFPAQVARQPANPPGVPATWIDTQGRTWTADYEMDPEIVDSPVYRDRVVPGLKSLPVLSIVARPADLFDNTTGIYPKSQGRGPSWERAASAEFIDWEAGTAAQANCGVQMQGNSVRDPVKTGKHAFRLVFKGDYGASKLRYRVFPDSPLEEYDTLTIRADFNNSWMHWNGAQRPRGQRVRDAWMKDSQRAMGGLSSHSRFFHLYVNGLYWGVYDATERPDASFAAAYQGGAKEEYDVVNEGQLVDGSMTAYNAMRALTGLETADGYERMAGYLDIPAYIDYVLLHFYTGHEDWFTDKNWYASRRRVAGGGFRYQSWDGELMLNLPSQNIVTRTDQPSNLHPKLVANAQYRMDFADRVQRHFFGAGALTPSAAAARYERWASRIEGAMVAESARWGDYRRDVHPYSSGPYELYTVDGHFRTERQRLLTTYFPTRTATVLAQLKAAGLYPANAGVPELTPAGGHVPSGQRLVMTAARGTIYFTTDGTDPRTRHTGAVAAGARPYTGPVTLEATTVVKARAQFLGEWSALVEAPFEVGSLGLPLALTEIHYHPRGGDPYEFVELRNYGGTAVDASGFSFGGLDYVFPPGSVLAAGRTMLLASGLSPGSFAARYPGVEVFGWFDGTLADGGERIELRDRAGRTVVSVDYDDRNGWPIAADGTGASLELLDPLGDPDAPSSWRASRVPDGTPGVPLTGGGPPAIRLNEILAAGIAGMADYVELHNAGGVPVDLAGWSLTDDGQPRRLVFPAGTRVEAGGFLVVPCTGVAGTGLEAAFALEREGETVCLYDPATNRVDVLTYGSQVAGSSVGRSGEDAAWRLGPPTPGEANRLQALAPGSALSINEWLADPPAGVEDWIEIYNRDPALPASLQGCWLTTSNATARLAALAFVAPGGHAVVRADEGAGAGHADLRLPAAGGMLALHDAAGALLERVDYGLQAPEVSQGRLPDGGGTIEAFPGSGSPGAANYRRAYTGPVLNEVLAWNQAALPGQTGPLVPGWIELHNRGAEAFDLGGMGLGGSADPGRAWRCPSGLVVPAGGYVLIACGPGLPASVLPDAVPNTGFGLARTGGGVWLFEASGRIADAVEFGFQAPGWAIGRTPAGWQLLEQATPGGANAGAAVTGTADPVRLNEWLAGAVGESDWVELHNRSDRPVALAGWRLVDHPGLSGAEPSPFPPLSFLGPRGFVRLEADGRPGLGAAHVGFQIASGGESLLLLDGAGRAIDVVYFGRQTPGVSLGRLPDGADGPFQSFARPTPGVGNATVAYRRPEIAVIGLEGGRLRLRVGGEAGPAYRLEGALDFGGWETLEVVRPAAVPFDWLVSVEAEAAGWFFRVVLEP